jgi:hypothetical protein
MNQQRHDPLELAEALLDLVAGGGPVIVVQDPPRG